MRKWVVLSLLGIVFMGLPAAWAGGFEDWCAQYNIVADSGGDPDLDGTNNFLEYAFGGDPTNSAFAGYLPELWAAEDGGMNWLYLSYGERSGDSGLMYAIMDNPNPIFAPWSSSLQWEIVGELPTPEGTSLIMLRTPIEFDQMSIAVEIDLDGGPTIRTEELNYPAGSSGGDYALDVTSGTGSGYYYEGDVVQVIADAAAVGMEFVGWDGYNELLDYCQFVINDYDQWMYYWNNRFSPELLITMPPFELWLEAIYQPISSVDLSSITISGPVTVDGEATTNYTCEARYTDGSRSNVTGTVQWSVSGTAASISASGMLSAGAVAMQESIAVSASYTDDGITKTDSLSVIVINPDLNVDYFSMGSGTETLVLSNEIFIASAGSPAASVQNYGGLEVYDCSFAGGENGSAGVSVQDIGSVFMTSSLSIGGDGASVENLEPDAELEAMGGDGIKYFGDTLNIAFENMDAVGGDGGLVRSFSAVAMEGDASGGCGVVLVPDEYSLEEHLIRFDGGRYEGGSGGYTEGLINDSYVMGGIGVLLCCSTNGSVLITDGVFVGGGGGFSFDGPSNADGGSGFVLEVGRATVSGGTFIGGQSGLGSSVNGGHGVWADDSDLEISGGSFRGGDGYDATYSGSGVFLENSTAIISGGDFAGAAYGGKLSAGLRVEDASADISGGNFESICFAYGGNRATFSGSPRIETLLQMDGITDIVLSGFSGSIEIARVEDGIMTVSGAPWALVPGSEIEITEEATLLVEDLQALSGSQITTEIGAIFAGTNLTFESGCKWTIDANGAGVTGVVELAMAYNLVSSLAPTDMILLGDGTTYVSSVFTSNSALYATVEAAPSGFDDWIEGIADVNLRGQSDTPAGDGVANLMKYACGFTPGTYVSNLFESAVLPGTPTNTAAFVVTYQKAKEVSDASVFPEWTDSLGDSWSSTGITIQKVGETTEQETWEALLPCSTNGYMRLKAEKRP